MDKTAKSGPVSSAPGHSKNGPDFPAPGQNRGKTAFPAPVYRDTVLAPVFADAKRYFLEPLLEIEYAHTLMLARQGIMTEAEAATCIRALDSLTPEEIRAAEYDGTFEDLFFYLEKK